MRKPKAADPDGKIMRGVVDACADCDSCRFLMDENCLFFPELYRLYDKEKEAGHPVGDAELRELAELCTFCGLCPCPDIRGDIIRSKTERVAKEGLPLGGRLLADVEWYAHLCGSLPGSLNKVLGCAPMERIIKKIVGIHGSRRLPKLDRPSFFAWAHEQGLDRDTSQRPAVAYFAGCTAGYLFPQVARAAVSVLQYNHISVLVPQQQCCGLPNLLEGDRTNAVRRNRENLSTLLKAVQAGYELVCSCPSCGFLMKVLLKEKAYYAEAYQRSVHAGADEIRIPDPENKTGGFVILKKSTYQKILTDNGYFAALDPVQRINLSNHVTDLGIYLQTLDQQGKLNVEFGKIPGHMAYFIPCHQREQKIGNPYEALLKRIPGLSIQRVGGDRDCCGMGGSLGFKESFYKNSRDLGRPLMRKIEALAPEAIITDCLSCRMQFEHLLPYPVFHPLELLSRAYQTTRSEKQAENLFNDIADHLRGG